MLTRLSLCQRSGTSVMKSLSVGLKDGALHMSIKGDKGLLPHGYRLLVNRQSVCIRKKHMMLYVCRRLQRHPISAAGLCYALTMLMVRLA